MRLNPRPHDAYCWKPFPGHDALFSPVFAKSLSDHSIGTYRLLSKQVGKTFEAVLSEVDNGIATIGPSAIVPAFLVTILYVNLDTYNLRTRNLALVLRLSDLNVKIPASRNKFVSFLAL